MGSVSKHRAMVKDRISGLPDAVLCHILSFLRTKYAVRTTVLSRRWKNVWTSVTCLNFNDDEDFSTTENGCYDFERFTTFVDRVLFSCDSSDIQKFCLAMRYPDGLARIDSWIWTAVRRNVVELDFHFQTGELFDFELPRSLVICKTLKVLRLSSSILTCAHPNPRYFPSLKFLHVTVCYFDNDMISKLFSDRPLLEGLTIDGGIRAKEVLNFMISAPKLKTLQMSLSVDNPHYVYNLSIDAPMLENLDIELDIVANCALESAKSLVKANIALDDCIEEHRPAAVSNRVTELLAQVCNVTYLSLSACCFEVSRSLLLFISAVLELNSLISVWILATYLLKNGGVLDKMIIDTSLQTKEELCKTFAMFQRGSVTCKVEFIKM